MSYRVYEAQAFVDTHLLMTLLLGEIFEFTVSFPVGDEPENCLIPHSANTSKPNHRLFVKVYLLQQHYRVQTM